MRLYSLLFLIGIFIGTVFLNIALIQKGNVLADTVEAYHVYMKTTFHPDNLVWVRLCMYRMSIAILVLCCIHWMASFDVFYLMIGLAGISFGYTLSLLTYCYGMKGILCMFAYLFPHGIIYILFIYRILKEASSQIYHHIYLDFKTVLIVFAIIIAGCSVENFINPVFLKIFLKNFL